MSTATVSRRRSPQSVPQDELQDELRHIRDLVFLRDALSGRGATAAELEEYDGVIDAARSRLADSARRASARFATAA